MKKQQLKLSICAVLFLGTYLILFAFAHMSWRPLPPLVGWSYTAMFISAGVLLVANLRESIFMDAAIQRRLSPRTALAMSAIQVLAFQLIAISSLSEQVDPQETYFRNVVLLQALNLVFWWAVVCASVGQKNFSRFWRMFPTDPFGAIGYQASRLLSKTRD